MVIASGAGDVTFGTIGVTNELSGLDVNAATAGTGDITFKGNIGTSAGGGNPGVNGTTSIGTATGAATDTENVHFLGSLYSFDVGVTTIAADADVSGVVDNIEVGTSGTDVEFKTAGEALTFVGASLDLANDSDLTINSGGGNVTVTGITGVSDETVTIEAGAGSVTLGAIGDSNHTQIHELDIDGGGGIILTGNIYTSGLAGGADAAAKGAHVNFGDPVTITGAVIIDTDDTAATDLPGDVTFTTSIDGTDSSTDTLTVESGSGSITLVAIGATKELEGLTINSQTTGTAALTVPNIGTGLINAATGAGVNGNVAIGNENTASITMSGLIYSVDGNITLTTAAGNTSQAEIIFSGGTAGADPFIGTDAGNVTLSGGEVELQNNSNLTINTNRLAGSTSGNISIAKNVDGVS